MDTEAKLLLELNNGKESALKEIYRLFFCSLCAFGEHFIKHDAVVADIVQEVFIKVWERRTSFQSVCALRSFMYLSVRNACLNHIRAQQGAKQILLVDVILDSFTEEENCSLIEEELYRVMQNEVDRLPEAIRKVFNLTLLDMSVPEIAQVLEISQNTVRNQRARAREILRERLKDKMTLFFLFPL